MANRTRRSDHWSSRLEGMDLTVAQSTTPLSPTDRTQIRRVRERAATDREALYDVLTAGLICHLGVVIDGAPRVLPTAFAFDPDGPDRDGTLYLHGSVAARSLAAGDRKSTRLNSSHLGISYAVFCLKKKKSALASATYDHFS